MNAPPRPPDESRPDALLAIVLISYAMIVIDNSIVITGLPARHLALLSADSKYGDGPTFPFIVDTPQQSGQDPVSLGPMLDNSLRRVHSGQSMVAAESIPGNWVPPEDWRILEFGAKRHVLLEESFRPGVEALSGMVKAMHDELLKQAPVG